MEIQYAKQVTNLGPVYNHGAQLQSSFFQGD